MTIKNLYRLVSKDNVLEDEDTTNLDASVDTPAVAAETPTTKPTRMHQSQNLTTRARRITRSGAVGANPKMLEKAVQQGATNALLELLSDPAKRLKNFLVEVGIDVQAATDRSRVTVEPDVPYSHRYGVAKLVLQLLIPFTLATLVLYPYITGSTDIIATIAATSVTALLCFVVCKIAYNMTTDTKSAHKKTMAALYTIAATVATGLILLVYSLVVKNFGITQSTTIRTMFICAGIAFVTLRIYFVWSHLIIRREGGMLYARLPSNIWLGVLKGLEKSLILANVVTCDSSHTTMDKILRCNTMVINSPGKLDKYWNKMRFVADAAQIMGIVKQVQKRK